MAQFRALNTVLPSDLARLTNEYTGMSRLGFYEEMQSEILPDLQAIVSEYMETDDMIDLMFILKPDSPVVWQCLIRDRYPDIYRKLQTGRFDSSQMPTLKQMTMLMLSGLYRTTYAIKYALKIENDKDMRVFLSLLSQYAPNINFQVLYDGIAAYLLFKGMMRSVVFFSRLGVTLNENAIKLVDELDSLDLDRLHVTLTARVTRPLILGLPGVYDPRSLHQLQKLMGTKPREKLQLIPLIKRLIDMKQALME